MRRAGKFLLAGVLGAVGLSAFEAQADFIITAIKREGTASPINEDTELPQPSLVGWDIYYLFVRNDGANGTGAGGTPNAVQGWDLEVTTPDRFFFDESQDVSGDFVNDINIFGKGSFVPLANTTQTNYNATGRAIGTYFSYPGFIEIVNAGTVFPFSPYSRTQNELGQIENHTPTDSGTPLGQVWDNVKTLRVSMSLNTPVPADTGNGIKFGMVIVPTGSGFTISGTFGNSEPQKYAFAPTSFGEVPEPASLGLVGLGMLALGRRRRA